MMDTVWIESRGMKLHHLTAEESLRSLGSRAEGLTAEEASRRLAEFGPILAVDLGTDLLPALALGAEPPHVRVMQQPPGDFRGRLLEGRLLARAYLFLGTMEAVAAMAAFFFVLGLGGWHPGEPLAWNAPLHLRATTACLGAIVVMQVANVLLCRTERAPTFSVPLRSNRLLLLGVAVELVLLMLIVYTPWGQLVFGTASLPASVWLFTLPFAGGMLLLEEARKAWVRRRAR